MIKVKVGNSPKGAVVVVRDSQGLILILKRAPSSYFAPSQWGFPGGKIELDESPLEAAVRETEEETELEVANLQPLGIFNGAVEAYLSEEFKGAVKLDFEHTDWRWLTVEEILEYDVAPSVSEILERVSELDDE